MLKELAYRGKLACVLYLEQGSCQPFRAAFRKASLNESDSLNGGDRPRPRLCGDRDPYTGGGGGGRGKLCLNGINTKRGGSGLVPQSGRLFKFGFPSANFGSIFFWGMWVSEAKDPPPPL